MKKVLFVAHVVKTHLMVFHIPYIKWFKENGYETHVCAKNDYKNKEECIIPYCDKYYDIPFERSPFHLNNIKAYKKLKEVIDLNEYEIIHCHTPVGGVLARLAAKKARKRGTKVIYTAHGFHFFKGAPILNWILFYPIEKYCARYTDVLITINKEDYKRANKSFKAGKVEYIPGVGIDINKFRDLKVDKNKKRKELGIKDNEIVLLSIGELIKRKNHESVIRALSKLNNPNITYLICGQGNLENYLKNISKDLDVNVKFLGFRKDINEICKVSDIFIFPSLQEGLPVALMEAMAAGLPCIVSNVRGNIDLVKSDNNKVFFNPKNIDEIIYLLNNIIENKKFCEELSINNLRNSNLYNICYIKEQLIKIYK